MKKFFQALREAFGPVRPSPKQPSKAVVRRSRHEQEVMQKFYNPENLKFPSVISGHIMVTGAYIMPTSTSYASGWYGRF